MSADPSSNRGAAPGPIRVLSVDDHPLLREAVAALLASQSDMTLVAEAANGHEAIEQFRTHRPDVTLMDLQMPEMDGLDAMIAIRGEFPGARIIVLTTYAGDVQVLRAIKVGAQSLTAQKSREKRPGGDDPSGTCRGKADTARGRQ
jgi:DNA-binding NarL/FixJ family response regulator